MVTKTCPHFLLALLVSRLIKETQCPQWRLIQMIDSSITAEMLAGTPALCLADRHHFKLNLSDLLDKSMQCKRNWFLNVIAATQLWRHPNSLCSQFQTDQMDDCRQSLLVDSLNPVPPNSPSVWARLSPQSTGTKDAISSAEDVPLWSLWTVKPFTDISNIHDVHKALQPLHKTSNESVGNAPTRQIDPANHSTIESPRQVTNGPVVAPAAVCSALSFSQPELSFQAQICFVFDNGQQQNLQMIIHHDRLWTGPGPLWTSELGTTWWLASWQTTPGENAWSQDQSHQKEQCQSTDTCRMVQTWPQNDGWFDCHWKQSHCYPLPASPQWRHSRRDHPTQESPHHHCSSHGSQPPERVDHEEGAQLVDWAFSPQVQPSHFHPRPAHQNEARGLLNKNPGPPLPRLPLVTCNSTDFLIPPLMSLIQFDSKRGRLLVCSSFCIHIASTKTQMSALADKSFSHSSTMFNCHRSQLPSCNSCLIKETQCPQGRLMIQRILGRQQSTPRARKSKNDDLCVVASESFVVLWSMQSISMISFAVLWFRETSCVA